MKTLILTESQINYIINEERGIAAKVIDLTNKIEQKIQSINAEPFKEYIFNIDDLKINYILTDFSNNKDAYDWYVKTERNDGYSFEENTIYLNIIFINENTNYSEFKNTIQHEVEHYWQCKNSGKNFITNKYKVITNEAINSENPIVQYICKLLYYCYKIEIDANVNGAYNSAMKSEKYFEDYKSYVYENGLKEIYTLLKNSKNNLQKYDFSHKYFIFAMQYLKTLNIFPKSYLMENIMSYMIKKTSNAFKYLIKQIGKTYSLYTEKKNSMENNYLKAKQKDVIKLDYI